MAEKQSSFDFLSLFKESKEKLSYSSSILPASSPEETKQSALLLSGMPLALAMEEGEVVSPILLKNPEVQRGIPLLFYRVKKDKDTVMALLERPYYNQMALAYLSSLSIEYDPAEDVLTAVSSLTKKLTEKGLADTVRVETVITVWKEEVLFYNSAYPLLSDIVSGKEIQEKYDSFFKEVKNVDAEKKIQENVFGYFAKVDRVLDRVSLYQGSKVSLQGKDTLLSYINRSLPSFLTQNKKVLFVASKEELPILREAFKELNLSSFVLEKEPDTEQESLSLLSSSSLPEPDEEKIKGYEAFQNLEARFLSFRKKKEECVVYPKDFRSPSFFEPFLDEKLSSFEPYPLAIESYSQEAYEADKKALDTIDTLESVKNSYVLNHPYFGLTLSNTRENYTQLQLLVLDLRKKLKNLQEKIASSSCLNTYEVPLNNLQDVATVIQDGKILSGYNGFPKKYFKINQDEEQKYSLTFLKKHYQALSSTKLVLLSFFGEDFLKEDLSSIVSDYESDKLPRKLKAKRKLNKFYSSSKPKSYDTLIKVIKAYNEERTLISSLLLDYTSVYGDSVQDMNGVVEIESNIAYIDAFRKRGEENPLFTYETPWVKRSIREKDFRVQVLAEIQSLSTAYDEFQASYKEYVGAYRDLRENEDATLSFEELDKKFEKEGTYSFEEFSEYLSFKEAFSSASLLLERTIRKYEEEKRLLSGLKKEYLYSLGVAYFHQGMKAFSPYKKDYQEVSKEFFDSLFTYPENYAEERYKEVKEAVEKKLSEEHVSEFIASLKQKEQLTSADREQIGEFLHLRYPIRLASDKDTYFYKEDAFDVVVLLDSSTETNLELLSALKAGQTNLSLNYRAETDRRTAGYHETLLNRNILYHSAFAIDSLSEKYYEDLSKAALAKGYQTTRDDDRYPLILTKGKKSYALLPDILVPGDITEDELSEYAENLACWEGLSLVEFDAYSFMEYPDNLFNLLKE